MAKTYKNLIYSNAEYTRSYSDFRGVELNGSNITSSPARLSYAKNVYKDYEGDGGSVIESVPGFRKILGFDTNINGLYYHKCTDEADALLVHADNEFFRCPIYNEDLTDINPELLGEISSQKSTGVKYGKYFYILDTENIYRLSEDGCFMTISDIDTPPYIPTMYVSGEKYEERNLLTDYCKEEYHITDPTLYYYSTDELKYRIIDPDLHYCAVSGIEDTGLDVVRIPSHVNISGEEYKVIEIDPYAFRENTDMTDVYISPGVKKIGMFAFYKCSGLIIASIPDTLTEICGGAFTDCKELSTIYLGSGIEKMGASAFSNCTSLAHVFYALDKESYDKIENISVLAGRDPVCNTKYTNTTLFFPVHESIQSIVSVSVDGTGVSYEIQKNKGRITGIIIYFKAPEDATGKEVIIQAILKEKLSEYDGSGIYNACGLNGYQAVAGCRVARVFDGRIFFAGNPLLPNTVFYTEKHETATDAELYIGEYNYFNDGVGSYPVKSMLGVNDMLAVFKSADDGTGSIFYHAKKETDDSMMGTIYPTAYVHSGTTALGSSASFRDDPVFLSSDGLSALDKTNINYDRSVVCRSHNVNYSLLKEDLSNASMFVWNGYLAICTGARIYLADSRSGFLHETGAREYEWFVIDGVGTYTEDENAYRYAKSASIYASAHPERQGEIVTEDVYSDFTDDGMLYYYTVEDDQTYLVEYTDEMIGGEFHPAMYFTANDKLLFFSTEFGDICVFNTDKRGVAPDSVILSEEYDEEEYKKNMGNKIHPFFYSFAGHSPEYVIKTAFDNCGIPHLTKDTVKKSLVIKSKSYVPESVICEVVTDNNDTKEIGRLPGADTDFNNIDFSNAPWYPTRYTSYALNEKEKRWVEKQIILRSNTFESPISIHSITYRYGIHGRIKNEI